MAVSDEAAPVAPAQDSAQPAVPAGMVMVKQSEHDAVQGDLRRIRKENVTLKQADTDRVAQEQQDAAVAAGKFDEALGVERGGRKAAETRASKAELGDAITDVLLARSFTGEQAVAIKSLVDRTTVELDSTGEPVATSVAAAVDAVVERFPNLFTVEKPADPETPAARTPRMPGPATPPPSGAEAGKPEGYISPEEYTRTPLETRYTPEFRKRAELSEAFWPKTMNRADLQQDAG